VRATHGPSVRATRSRCNVRRLPLAGDSMTNR
jgi:hypothetical protein